jgi:hypothetical protein
MKPTTRRLRRPRQPRRPQTPCRLIPCINSTLSSASVRGSRPGPTKFRPRPTSASSDDYPGDAAVRFCANPFFTGYWLRLRPVENQFMVGKRELLRSRFWLRVALRRASSGELRDEPYTLKRVAEDTQAAAAAAPRRFSAWLHHLSRCGGGWPSAQHLLRLPKTLGLRTLSPRLPRRHLLLLHPD